MKKTTFVLYSAGALAASVVGCHYGLAQSSAAAAEPASAAVVAAPTSPPPFQTPPVLAGTPDIATLVAKVRPSVVNITTTHQVHGIPNVSFGGGGSPFDLGPFQGMVPGMRRPFGGREEGDGEMPKERALGSGFLIDPEGHVVTNNHVIDGADEVKVKLADEREFTAKVKGRDPRLDIAVLELVGAKDLPFAAVGSSQEMRVGEYVVAIGNPFGLGDSVTMGIISAKSRAIGMGPYDDLLQTDASINPGNSGGPLFNLRGQVVGINTAINPAGKGIGFAVPADALRDVLPQLLSTGHVERGKLGVMIQPVDETLAKALGLDHPKGALIGDVDQTGAGARAGLHTGDVVVSVDGVDVPHAQDLPRMVARHAPGTQIKVGVLRDRSEKTFDVTLDALKETQAKADNDADESAPDRSHGLGIQLGDGPNGPVVQGIRRGGAAGGMLSQGDVILEVNRKKVADSSAAAKAIAATPKGQPVLLKVRSAEDGRTRYVAVERG